MCSAFDLIMRENLEISKSKTTNAMLSYFISQEISDLFSYHKYNGILGGGVFYACAKF